MMAKNDRGEKMDMHENQRAAYAHICEVYDRYARSLDLACKQGCAACCTINVTLTSLEACAIADRLDALPQGDRLWDRVTAAGEARRFCPQSTFNQIARYYADGVEPPDEETPDPAWGYCPLLMADGSCPVYEVRPFACRCMVSEAVCDAAGSASISSFTMTVGTVMHQYVEHVDRAGVSGNLVDLLLYLRPRHARDACKALITKDLRENFPANTLTLALLAGPEDKERLASILDDLNRFR